MYAYFGARKARAHYARKSGGSIVANGMETSPIGRVYITSDKLHDPKKKAPRAILTP